MQSKFLRHTVFFALLIFSISTVVITFGYSLQYVIQLHHMLPSFFILFSFIAVVISTYLYRHIHLQVAQEISRLFTPKIQHLHIPLLHIPLLFISTLLSHLFGASVGREGVAVQLGGSIGNYFMRQKKRYGITVPSRVIITTSMATGFAALFGMPLTAAFFAIEVSQLYKKTQSYFLLFPFLGSLSAAIISSRSGLSHMHFHVSLPTLSFSFFLGLLLLAILLIITTFLYLFIHHHLTAFLKQKIPAQYPRIIFGALLLSSFIFIFKLDSIKGLGSVLISDSFQNPQRIHFLTPWLKVTLTLSFLALGFKGGEVTPIFAIGATLGAITALSLNLPAPFFAAIGLACFFSSTTKTYLAALMLIAEITSPLIAPFLIPYLFIMYFFTPKKGVYQK